MTWDLSYNAAYLDNKRLGKQRVECLQILNTLAGKTKGWRHHPAVLMWVGHEDLLKVYMDYVLVEWISRGFKNTILFNHPGRTVSRHGDVLREHWMAARNRAPDWWGDERILASHRSNLLRKDPEWYGDFGWKEPSNLPYYWPVTKEDLIVKNVLRYCV